MDQIADTILQQLGGSRFLAMTGTKLLSYGERKLNMRFPAAKRGVNHLTVTLEADDTYTMRFGKLRNLGYTEVESFRTVYAEDLRGIFTHVTGLHTHL
jgi:hypothetical protein